MRARKGRLPLIHLFKIKPDWIHSNGLFAFGIQLNIALNMNQPASEFQELRVGKTYINKRKKDILPFLFDDRSMEIFNDYTIENICRVLNVNCVVMARYKSMTQEIFSFRKFADRETIYFHSDQTKFNKGDFKTMALIYDLKEKGQTNIYFLITTFVSTLKELYRKGQNDIHGMFSRVHATNCQ